MFAGSAHVVEIGLEHADDGDIWEFAKANSFVVVTKDADFQQRSFLFGPPPAVVWLRLGNASTSEIEDHVRANSWAILDLEDQGSTGILIIEP